MNKRGRGLFIVSFLAPAVIIYATMVIYPLLQSFAFSAYRWRGLSMRKTYIGGENFTNLAKDEVFHKAARNNLTLFVVAGFAILVIAVAVAHGLQGQSKTARTLRSIVLFPQMISLVAVAVLWMFIFNPQFGLVTSFLKGLGLDGSGEGFLANIVPRERLTGVDLVHTWLGESRTALPAVGVAFVWYAVGFYIMLFAAGLKSVPAEIIEASELDGATGFRRFWRVTWPMLWSVKRIAVVHIAITVMNVFVLVLLMTRGGPDHATEMMLTYLYDRAFSSSQVGYATAIAVANFVIVMVLAGLILLAFRKDPTERRTA